MEKSAKDIYIQLLLDIKRNKHVSIFAERLISSKIMQRRT